MSKPEDLHPTLHSALHLDGSPRAIKQFYADWADKYEQDTLNWNYAAPANALLLMTALKNTAGLSFDPQNRKIQILDAGCGTGFLATLMHREGYCNIDGFDISPDMVAIAAKLGIYRELEGDVDINQPVRDQWKQRYDCTISVGVFTPGHVPPGSLIHLVEMTRPGGVVIVSTRVAYYESENYQDTADQLEAAGRIRLLNAMQNASYTTDELAHYWVYEVLAKP